MRVCHLIYSAHWLNSSFINLEVFLVFFLFFIIFIIQPELLFPHQLLSHCCVEACTFCLQIRFCFSCILYFLTSPLDLIDLLVAAVVFILWLCSVYVDHSAAVDPLWPSSSSLHLLQLVQMCWQGDCSLCTTLSSAFVIYSTLDMSLAQFL